MCLAIGIVTALGKAHQHGLVHKDLKPTNILVTGIGSEVRLTGFGLASRLRRERPSPEAPEDLAGTLAYMSPEQTAVSPERVGVFHQLADVWLFTGITFAKTPVLVCQ